MGSEPSGGSIVLGLLLIALGIGVYFLPSIIADFRNHTSLGGIAILNLFLGWTFLGWLIALIWACSGEYKPHHKKGAGLDDDDDGDETRRCPYCAETIKRQAIVCKHCGSDVVPAVGRPKIKCASCGLENLAERENCVGCGAQSVSDCDATPKAPQTPPPIARVLQGAQHLPQRCSGSNSGEKRTPSRSAPSTD